MEHTEPKHKPSPKHALDDVLSSLQDLMHNELNDAQPPSPIAAPATRRGGGRFDRNTTGIKGQALADQGHRGIVFIAAVVFADDDAGSRPRQPAR